MLDATALLLLLLLEASGGDPLVRRCRQQIREVVGPAFLVCCPEVDRVRQEREATLGQRDDALFTHSLKLELHLQR